MSAESQSSNGFVSLFRKTRRSADAAAAPVLQAFSVITVVTSLAQIHHSLLRRNLRFFEIGIVASVSAAATAVVGKQIKQSEPRQGRQKSLISIPALATFHFIEHVTRHFFTPR